MVIYGLKKFYDIGIFLQVFPYPSNKIFNEENEFDLKMNADQSQSIFGRSYKEFY
jgi:hypothetical protein